MCQSQQFFGHSGMFPGLSTEQGINCVVQGHENRLKPAIPQSEVE